ncbi:molybdenum cofactor biosynthesis protein MoaE [Georgenia sp. 311]|uniref:Molybdenum cofactor biosynthesis protein MoaE n=1 Tax=Georgenia wutianyii TaxID=2585135 RepID=A0ABX5VKK3_9MICO|nr:MULTISPECIES: molybdenum cofactor biosynthesis protein MoaE [Georgenia]QDB78206.1 molybdenum cofactor biosynthesis protein MoaE [Georgenia wutianyii]TNC16896.1 molybdenum cofactor biosynthesis protein MoaE [Georgenia sp. 311]
MGESTLTAVSAEPLDLSTHLAAVSTASTGAVATFIGQVRDHSPDATDAVVRLEYSAHPDVERALEEIVADVVGPHEDVRVAVSHRVGVLDIGDVAIIACAASSHRDLAFTVCREVVEAVKARLPVWKKQVLADGSHTWVGSA